MRYLLCLLSASSLAMATTVWGTSAAGELTGDRDSDLIGGITVANTTVTPAIEISWDITSTIVSSAVVYTYTYTITGPNSTNVSSNIGGLGVGDFALQLPSVCGATLSATVTDTNCVTSATVTQGATVQNVESGLVYGPNTSGNGDFNFPGSFYGVRVTPTALQLPITVSFNSDLAPIYGDVYLKLGNAGPPNSTKGDSAWNNGSNAPSDTSTNILDFIAVPGGTNTAPEPATLGLLGAGLLAIGLYRKPRRARHSSKTSSF